MAPPIVDKNRGPEILAVFCTGTAVAAFAVALRLWVRIKILRKVGLDDWLVTASLILSLVSMGLFIKGVSYGLGRHTKYLSAKQSSGASKMLWIAFCITPSAEGAAKASISIMLIRITTNARWKNFLYTLIAAIGITTLAALVGILCTCQPVELLWNPVVKGTCNITLLTVIGYVQGVSAAVFDIILAISPIWLLWNVQINRHQKVLLCGLLALGFFTSVAGLVRATYTPELSTKDPTWNVVNFLIWKTVELPLSIIVGCLPTLRPLFQKREVTKASDGRYSSQPSRNTPSGRGSQIKLSDQPPENKIQHTTSIEVVTVDRSSEEGSLSKQNAWPVEDRV